MKQYQKLFIDIVTFDQADVVTLSAETQNTKDVLFDASNYFNY